MQGVDKGGVIKGGLKVLSGSESKWWFWSGLSK